MYQVYEVDYHGRAHLIGKTDTIEDARKKGKQALKKSGHEFPVFIDDGLKVVVNIR